MYRPQNKINEDVPFERQMLHILRNYQKLLDLIYKLRKVGCSKFRYKSDIKSARIQLVKLLTFNTLYCEIVL